MDRWFVRSHRLQRRRSQRTTQHVRVALVKTGVRRTITKIKHLLALGVSLKTAIQHGVSSKSHWHMARTPALQQALSNAWLKAQGLVSVKDLWSKAQGYTNLGT